MNQSWLYIMALLFASSYGATYFASPLVSVALDLLVLVIAYFILRRDPWVDMRSSMTFLSILIGVSILATLGFIDNRVYTEAMIALIGWSWFGLKSRLFQAFIFGAAIYNSVFIYQLYQTVGILDVGTTVVTLGAIALMAYVNR